MSSSVDYKPGGEQPITEVRSVDPGDTTERNYRYQHSYGVILLVAAKRGTLECVAIYCEHHEDFLAERPDGLFDAYQIKTSRPEGGAWNLKSEALVKSIGRFVELISEFPSQIGRFFFVSNSDIERITDASTDSRRRSRCLGPFLSHLKTCSSAVELKEPYRTAFEDLKAEIACGEDVLFQVLSRLDIIKGPSRDDFDAVLSHEHLARLPECSAMAADELDGVRDDLVALFHRAASLGRSDPDIHVRGLFSGAEEPVILAKKIVCAEVPLAVKGTARAIFVGESTIELGELKSPDVLKQKLERGGLADLVEFMKERETAAEYRFLEDQAKNAGTAGRLLKQVEESVHGECLEAFMANSCSEDAFGQAMFNDLASRLRRLEQNRADLLGGYPYEILMGTAALLTSQCRVWWSRRFKITGEAQ